MNEQAKFRRAEKRLCAFLDSLPDDLPETIDSINLPRAIPGASVVLIPLGGAMRLGQIQSGYACAFNGRNWTKGERFLGRGENYVEASRAAIKTFIELLFYRSRQEEDR